MEDFISLFGLMVLGGLAIGIPGAYFQIRAEEREEKEWREAQEWRREAQKWLRR